MDVTANERRDDDAMDDDDAGWQGNRRRKLWKSTCTRAAFSVSTIHPSFPEFA